MSSPVLMLKLAVFIKVATGPHSFSMYMMGTSEDRKITLVDCKTEAVLDGSVAELYITALREDNALHLEH